MVTLKDVYTSQQQIERRLADTLGELKITLTTINSHLSGLDQRNAAADELHKEQGRRLDRLERVIDAGHVEGLDARVRQLETSDTGAEAVAAATKEAESARHQSTVRLWQVVGTMGGLVGLIVAIASVILAHG